MNKYLMMSAAAALATASAGVTPASAGSTRVGFSGFCDGMEINTTSIAGIYTTKHLYTGCGWTTSENINVGASGKNKQLKAYVGSKKQLYSESTASTSLGFGYLFGLPLANGSAWAGMATSTYYYPNAWNYLSGTIYTGYSHQKGAKSFLKATTTDAKAKVAQHLKTRS